jgi:hypothetical protein
MVTIEYVVAKKADVGMRVEGWISKTLLGKIGRESYNQGTPFEDVPSMRARPWSRWS